MMRGTRFFKGAFLVYAFLGCGPEDCAPTLDFGSSGGSSQGCGPGVSWGGGGGGCELTRPPGVTGDLGNGTFQYLCPSGQSSDAWCMAGGVLQQTLSDELPEASAEAGDASEDAAQRLSELVATFGAFAKRDGGAALESSINSGIPDVLMGAPFQLSYTPFAADAGTLAPAPVLASLAESVTGGSALRDNEWAAYTVMQGTAMLDYMHVHARPLASLEVVVGSTFDSPVLTMGSAAPVVVLPLAVDGSVLGGAIACTFVTSDPSVATVRGMGASAILTPVAAGFVTVQATCMAVIGSATVTIEPPVDAGSDATADDAPSNPEVGADTNVDHDGTSASDAASENNQSGALDAGDEG